MHFLGLHNVWWQITWGNSWEKNWFYLMFSQTSRYSKSWFCCEILSGCLKEIFTKMGILLQKCDAINFTECNELLVPCHCCGTLTIIDGYWYIENEWMNIEKRLHKIFKGWERNIYTWDWIGFWRLQNVPAGFIYHWSFVSLWLFCLNDCSSLLWLFLVEIMKHVV